jgi:long-chain acyl-CoA synthetase
MALMTEKLRAIMMLDPARAEIDFAGDEFTWGQIAAAVKAIDGAFELLNLPTETRIGVMLRNKPGHVAAAIAILCADCCLVTLNPLLPDAKVLADVEALGLPVILVDTNDLARPGFREALIQGGVGLIEIGPLLEAAKLLARPRAGLTITTAPGVAIEMLSSGTTGDPKRIPLTRSAFDASFAGFTRYQRDREFEDAPRLRSGTTMVVNPLTHIGGIYGCIGALMEGRKIVLLERFTVEDWVAAIKRNRPKVAPAVPSAIKMILEANVPKEALSSLVALISGTAPLSPEVVDEFYARYALPILANYGATEFAGAVAGWTIDDFREHWASKRGSVGRVHADIEARVVDGLLEIKGAQLGNGGAWLRTTDRAVIDADNFLFILGRADNAIIRGGFKVHPDDVIKALQSHPAVREAAVVGVPDDRLGEVPAAAIILRVGEKVLTTDAIKSFLKERLIAYQVPVHYRFVDDFPRTPSMKPSTPGLQALF